MRLTMLRLENMSSSVVYLLFILTLAAESVVSLPKPTSGRSQSSSTGQINRATLDNNNTQNNKNLQNSNNFQSIDTTQRNNNVQSNTNDINVRPNNNFRNNNNFGSSQQNRGANVVDFATPVPLSGGNSRTVIQYADGLNIDTISANQHILTVQLNQRPPSTDFVTSLDPSRSPVGGPWIPLSGYSYVMSFENTNPDDLIMRIQVPYDQGQLNSRGVSDNNVYLAVYEPMRGGWVIDADRSENRRQARVTEINAIAAPRGEYILLARQTAESNDESNPFLRFGASPQNIFNVLPPPQGSNMPPLQIGSWQDGSKIFIRSSAGMQMQMSIANVSTAAVPIGFQSASRYACIIDSSSSRPTVVTHLQMPYVPTLLSQRNIDPSSLMVLGRPLGSTGSYQALSSTSLSGSNVLMNTPMTMSAGEFILAAPGNPVGRSILSPGSLPGSVGTPGQSVPVTGPTEAMILNGASSFAASTSTNPASATRLVQQGTENISPAGVPITSLRQTNPIPLRQQVAGLSALSTGTENPQIQTQTIQMNPLSSVQQIGGASTRISEIQNAQIRVQTNNALANTAFQGSNNIDDRVLRAFDPNLTRSNSAFNPQLQRDNSGLVVPSTISSGFSNFDGSRSPVGSRAPDFGR